MASSSQASICRTAIAQPGPKIRLQARLVQAAEAARPRNWLKQDLPVVLAGDYNVAPNRRSTSIRRQVHGTTDALIQPKKPRVGLQVACVDQGWTDAIRATHPSKPMFTVLGLQAQPLAARRGLAARSPMPCSAPMVGHPRLIKAGVDRKIRGEEGASDHAPGLEFVLD